MLFSYYVIIATSFNRINLLINRALKSVYNQKLINKSNVKVIIVDDNIREQKERIIKEIFLLREKFKLKDNEFETFVLINNRIKGHSGTGAWNTGIFFVTNFKNWEKSYIAFLDDDDEYLPYYLYYINKSIERNNNRNVVLGGIFCQLIWKKEERKFIKNLTVDKLTQREFLIGNPGVQGSNMCFLTKLLIAIKGFDERFFSATDRELMIRILDYIEYFNRTNKKKIVLEVIEKPCIIHYHHTNSITNNKLLKKKGLDLFYRKFWNKFDQKTLEESLKRAKIFFDYELKI